MEHKNYLTPSIYICKEIFEPKGVCYSKKCRKRELRVVNKTLTDKISIYSNGRIIPQTRVCASKRTEISAYLSKEDEKPRQITVYILKNGDTPTMMKAYPPCSSIEALTIGADWKREGDSIYAVLPLPEHCGVEYFKTVFSEESVRFDYPGHLGEADGENVKLTFDDGGFISHRTRLDRKYLIPGCEVSVSFKLAGFNDFQAFAFFRFETDIFTTAKVKGCGLAELRKIYHNILKPETGYTYQYMPAAGGEGFTAEDEWIFDTRFRYMVEYRGETYWLRSSDFAAYSPGETVAVIKSADEMPLHQDTEMSSSCVAETLSEERDIIASELFYGRL